MPSSLLINSSDTSTHLSWAKPLTCTNTLSLSSSQPAERTCRADDNRSATHTRVGAESLLERHAAERLDWWCYRVASWPVHLQSHQTDQCEMFNIQSWQADMQHCGPTDVPMKEKELRNSHQKKQGKTCSRAFWLLKNKKLREELTWGNTGKLNGLMKRKIKSTVYSFLHVSTQPKGNWLNNLCTHKSCRPRSLFCSCFMTLLSSSTISSSSVDRELCDWKSCNISWTWWNIAYWAQWVSEDDCVCFSPHLQTLSIHFWCVTCFYFMSERSRGSFSGVFLGKWSHNKRINSGYKLFRGVNQPDISIHVWRGESSLLNVLWGFHLSALSWLLSFPVSKQLQLHSTCSNTTHPIYLLNC